MPTRLFFIILWPTGRIRSASSLFRGKIPLYFQSAATVARHLKMPVGPVVGFILHAQVHGREPSCIDERRLLAPIRQALIEYRDTEESRPLTALVEQAVGETAGELLVHFGQAGMAGTVVF